MRPRHADLRPFAVNSGDDVFVLPTTASYNEARMLPFSGGEQFVFSANLDIHPSAT